MPNLSEIELDPAGYVPRASLFARNLSSQPVSFNVGLIRWFLGAKDNVGDDQPLPWTVALSPGFQRLWDRGEVLVALDPDFTEVITTLPSLASFKRGAHVHRQDTPQSVVDIEHELDRAGPVHVAVFSPDGHTEYWNFYTDLLSDNACRLSFEDPISFIATVS